MIKSLPVLCNQSVSAIVITLCLASPVWASDKLSPRAEVNVRAGTERSILMTEFWAPLAQQSDRVLYGDLRLMGDDGDNREGNLGFGYRQISPKTNSVLGANAWIDRRRTENGNNFHQITLGVESLGETIDIRANGYIQLNGSKTKVTPNIGSATPYLAGSGIFFDTNGFIVEEPQHGFDAEVGYRLPVLQKYIDSTRVYVGGYHFFGDTTDSTTGFRLRTEAQINSIFSVGARFQHDDPRGSQGFLEATLRFPFKSKKLYQEHGLRSRLDESPERDIDIVTGSKIDTGLTKPVINETSGAQQRILYVDNTNTQFGDGTKDNPFNTLAVAQTALQANDILYINHGDGTTTGMDQGIVIDKDGIQLIGSGSDLAYAGYTLLSATIAPNITNIQTAADDLTGNGILVMADNASISGVSINGTKARGIYARNDLDNRPIHKIEIKNVSVSNNTDGIAIVNNEGSSIQNILVNNSNISNNRNRGIVIAAEGVIQDTLINNNISVGNGQPAVLIYVVGNGIFESVAIKNNVLNNSQNGIFIYGGSFYGTQGGVIQNLLIEGNNTINNSNGHNVAVVAENGGIIENTIVKNNLTSGSARHGIVITANSANSYINNAILLGNTSNNNASSGYSIDAVNGGVIGSVLASNNTANNNLQRGFNALANGGIISDLSIDRLTSDQNTLQGVFVQANGAAGVIGSFTLSNSTTSNNRNNGILVQAAGGSQVGSINILENTSSNNNLTTGGRGIFIQASGASSLISSVNLSGNTTNNNINQGIAVQAANTSRINTMTLTNNTSNGNLGTSGQGIQIEAISNGAVINSSTLSGNITNNNAQNGVYIYTTALGAINNNSIAGTVANSNTQSGVYLLANGGTINNSTLTNLTTNFNSQQGVYLNSSAATSNINSVTLSGIIANNNLQNGILVNAANSTTASISNVSVSNTDTLNNGVNGIFLQKGNASSIFDIDLGGGALGSTGQNKSFGNIGRDLRLSYAGGGNVFAKNNWWGVNTGLAAGRMTLSASTTVDATAFLTTDPRP